MNRFPKADEDFNMKSANYCQHHKKRPQAAFRNYFMAALAVSKPIRIELKNTTSLQKN
jgi:hypothetical protein